MLTGTPCSDLSPPHLHHHGCTYRRKQEVDGESNRQIDAQKEGDSKEAVCVCVCVCACVCVYATDEKSADVSFCRLFIFLLFSCSYEESVHSEIQEVRVPHHAGQNQNMVSV